MTAYKDVCLCVCVYVYVGTDNKKTLPSIWTRFTRYVGAALCYGQFFLTYIPNPLDHCSLQK